MLKAVCSCGYTARITSKWVDEVGPPHCPMHGPMSVENSSQDAEEPRNLTRTPKPPHES